MIEWGLVAACVLWLICLGLHGLWWKRVQSRRQASLMKQQMELTKIAMGAEMIMAVAPLLKAMDIALAELEEAEKDD